MGSWEVVSVSRANRSALLQAAASSSRASGIHDGRVAAARRRLLSGGIFLLQLPELQLGKKPGERCHHRDAWRFQPLRIEFATGAFLSMVTSSRLSRACVLELKQIFLLLLCLAMLSMPS
jgi:hypothetical protein